ncbi:MAG: beta-ketoacyl-ACP synthase II [Alphaproteobacteria bacterium]|nr:beta-ketoacyl-ACP synthase II [Alphaproteobacteria bacterium]
MRRVVITGVGLTTPLGVGQKINTENLFNARSGIKKISSFDTTDFACKIAGQIPLGDQPGEFNFDSVADSKERRRMDDFIVYGLSAAEEAIKDSGWLPKTEEQQNRTGVLVGSGIGGLKTLYDYSKVLSEEGPRRVSPFFIPASLINLLSGHISIRYSLKGPNSSVVTACATGTHAIGDASRLIMFGDADVMVAGGAEAPVNELGVAGFIAARTLSTKYNDTPETASRPWDKNRDGFVMGEGAGILVLEEYEHAKKRGAKIYGEVIGYGLSGDAYHITSPAPDGNGGRRAMENALRNAKLNTQDIDYINAHGTSTPVGDMLEFNAVKTLFGENLKKVSMSSTKSATGHLLGAAGAVEAIYSLIAMQKQTAPPTLNLTDPEEETIGCDLVPLVAKERKIDIVLSNSFGFGGTNASVIFKKV